MTTEAAAGTVDLTVMYAAHDAFRRDLARLGDAAADGTAFTPQVRAGWDNFRHQLHIHHTAEDSDLWPRVERKVAGRPRDVALLAEMEAEHALLDPQLTAVDSALKDRSAELPALVRSLASALDEHLAHEEESALPLIREVLTPADWGAFTGRIRKTQGVRGAARTGPQQAVLGGGLPQARAVGGLRGLKRSGGVLLHPPVRAGAAAGRPYGEPVQAVLPALLARPTGRLGQPAGAAREQPRRIGSRYRCAYPLSR
jgi:iron-sulfur cluster repair protein YtfE (RIC family)